MLLTDKVSIEWLDEQEMVRGEQIGVPRNPITLGLTWKNLLELTDEDFDAIEAYYDKKTATA